MSSQRRKSGADTRIRTGDLILTKDALYLLSYISMLRIKLLRCCIEWILTKDALYLLSYISTLLHRATDIYYHIFGEKSRGIFKKIKNILQNRCGRMERGAGSHAGAARKPGRNCIFSVFCLTNGGFAPMIQ